MPTKTSGTRGAKRNKKAAKLRDLPAQGKRAAAVKGGQQAVTSRLIEEEGIFYSQRR